MNIPPPSSDDLTRYINCYFNEPELQLMKAALDQQGTPEAATLSKILDVLLSKLKRPLAIWTAPIATNTKETP